MSNQDKLINRIKKLLAMANDKGASQNETEVALRMANSLLIKHNLTMTDVQVSSIQKDVIESDKNRVGFGGIKEEGRWESPLMSTLCQYNFCHSITHTVTRVHGGSITVIGKKENVEIVLYLFDVARTIFRSLSKEAYNTHRKDVLEENRPLGLSEKDCLRQKKMGYRMPWIRTYLKGCVLGLADKLESEKKQVQANQDRAIANKFALVCTNTELAIRNFMDDKYKNLRTTKRNMKVSKDHGALSSGISAGKSVSLQKGLAGANDPQTKRLS